MPQAVQHEFFTLRVSGGRAQPPAQPIDGFCSFALGDLRDGLQRRRQAVDREANRVREIRVEDQEFRDPFRTQLGCIHFTVGFKRRTGLKQTNPLQEIAAHADIEFQIGIGLELGFEQTRRRRRTFDRAPDLDELPAFTVRHGRVGDALKQVAAFLDRLKELVRLVVPDGGDFRAAHLHRQAVDLFPHL